MAEHGSVVRCLPGMSRSHGETPCHAGGGVTGEATSGHRTTDARRAAHPPVR
jgi:hypothetical protein